MYKIAGELTSAVFHVTARAIAAQGLSIFGDQLDVMATRQTGFALLCSNSVQEVMDIALITHAATLQARIPFVHFFDGFRTSHEVMKVEQLSQDDIRAMIDDELDPQAALDRPRFCLLANRPGGKVALEEGIPFEVLSELALMGHPVIPISGYSRGMFGRGQIIKRDPENGALWAGSDPRADGCAMTLV